MTAPSAPNPGGPEPWLKDGDFPTELNCNPAHPEEAWVPALLGLPGMKGASMALPVSYLRMWSQRLFQWGGPPDPSKRQIYYHPPRSGEINPMFAAGEWKDEPYVPDPADMVDLNKLSLAMQAEIARQVDEKRAGQERPPQKPSAKVGRLTRFDPTEHSVAEVLAHLRDAGESEVRRVIALEREGSKRRGVLKRYE